MPISDEINRFKENVERLPESSFSVKEDSAPIRDVTSVLLIRSIVCFDEKYKHEYACDLLSKSCGLAEFQISYSEIHKLLYNTDRLDSLVSDSLYHCEQLARSFKESESRKVLSKIAENVRLSCFQIKQMLELSASISESNRRRIEESNRETTKSILSQLIGVVSIFTALAFILFGGITGVSSIKDLIIIGGSDTATMLLCFFLFGLIMLGCLILFIYFILQIVNPNGSGCHFKRVIFIVIVPIVVAIIILFGISKCTTSYGSNNVPDVVIDDSAIFSAQETDGQDVLEITTVQGTEERDVPEKTTVQGTDERDV